MLEVLKAAILGLVQGLTEFIPVSSSGHLTLVPKLLGWKEYAPESTGIAFAAVLHLGTLAAILYYFRADWASLVKGFFSSLRKKPSRWGTGERLAWLLVLATFPAATAGFFLEGLIEEKFTGVVPVGVALLCCALLMSLAEISHRRKTCLLGMEEIRASNALAMGLFQVFALAPGLSRSGATISGGMLTGLEKDAAARFSFLMLAPITLGAGIFELFQLLRGGAGGQGAAALVVGFLASAASGTLAIKYLLRYLRRGQLLPFITYCVSVGTAAVLIGSLR